VVDELLEDGGRGQLAGGMTLDIRRGLVFADGVSGVRSLGWQSCRENLFANCVLALRAETVRRVWHFPNGAP